MIKLKQLSLHTSFGQVEQQGGVVGAADKGRRKCAIPALDLFQLRVERADLQEGGTAVSE